jgi:hypothetical protein
MNLTKKLQRILPLSAASVALLQSGLPSKGEISISAQSAPDGVNNRNEQINSQAKELILAPAHQEQLLKMYAGHTSHASHASHYSGTGGGYSTPSVDPTPQYPTYPAQAPVSPSYVQPKTAPKVSSTPVSTAHPINQTNSVASTNTPPRISAEEDAANVELLKKQAAAGDSDAQFTLSLYYYYGGHGLKKSEDKAEMLLELSAIQGNFGATNRLNMLKAQQAQKLEKDSGTSETPKDAPTQ